MKIYGSDTYKGYIIRRDKTTNKAISKHYVSAVDRNIFSKDKINISFRDENSDMVLSNYKIGTNKNVDTAVKCWYVSRGKAKQKRPFLHEWEKNKLFGK